MSEQPQRVVATSSSQTYSDPADEFFVFAGKIYRRSRDDLYTPAHRRQQQLEAAARLVLSAVPVICIAAYVWSARLLVPPNHKNKTTADQSKTGNVTFAKLPKSRAQGTKIIFPASGAEGVLQRSQLAETRKSTGTTTLMNRTEGPPAVLSTELRELSAALASLGAGEQGAGNAGQSGAVRGVTEEEFEILRATILKQRNAKLLREDITKLQSRVSLSVSEKLKSHPLCWLRTSKFGLDQDLVELVASLATPLTAMDLGNLNEKCSRCGAKGEQVASRLSPRRYAAFFDLCSRDWFDEDLERLIWLILRTKERPEEVFLEEDAIRIVEPPAGKWTDIIGASWQHDFYLSDVFSTSVRYFPEDANKQPIDTLVRSVESCLLSGAMEDDGKERLMVSCAVADSKSSPRRIYGFRGARFNRYDVVVDVHAHRVYFNSQTRLGSNVKLQKLVLAILNGNTVIDRLTLASRILGRNVNMLKTLLAATSQFSETWVCTISAACIGKPDKKGLIDKIKSTIRKELSIPSHGSIGCCIGGLSGSPMIGSFTMNDSCVIWISPMVPLPPSTASLTASLLGEDVQSSGTSTPMTTALVFVRDRAFCGCKFQMALRKACA